MMPVYGSTQVYLFEVVGDVATAQAAARVWELRGFELISVASGSLSGYVLAMRASSTLYVNWLMDDIDHQAGPYDGQDSAEKAMQEIVETHGGPDIVKDAYVTAQRDHERKFVMGDPNA